MARLNIGGQTVTVDDSFLSLPPEQQEATVDEIAASLKTPADPLVDIAKSVGVGAARGVIGLADLPELGARGIQAGVNLVQRGLGMEETPRPGTQATFAERFDGGQDPLTPAQAIQSKIEETTGPFYQPQTTAGELAHTVGEFLPGMVGGPGGLATRAITRVAAPIAGMEAAGAAAKGTRFETPARIAGAVAAGPAAGRVLGGRALPTAQQLKAPYGQHIENPQTRAIPMPQAARGTEARTVLAGPGFHIADDVPTPGLADDIKAGLLREGYDPLNSPTAFKRVEHIATFKNPTIGDLIDVRQKLSRDSRGFVKTNETEMLAADEAKRQIDRVIAERVPEFREVNRNYAIGKTVDTLQGERDKALYQANAANSGLNEGNRLRARAAAILTQPKFKREFYGQDWERLKKINEGTRTGNTARYVGNLLGKGGGLGAGVLGGGVGYFGSGGDPQTAGLLGLAAIGTGRGIGAIDRAITKRQMSNLERSIRARGTVPASKRKLTKEDLIRALLQGSAASPSER